MLVSVELGIHSNKHNMLEPSLPVRVLKIGIHLGILEKLNLKLNNTNHTHIK